MKISRKFVVGTMATIVYWVVIIVTCLQFYEPLKIFMESGTGRFWGGVVIYVLTIFFAIWMPVYGVKMSIDTYKDSGFSEESFVTVIIALVLGFLGYPIIAHAVGEITESGLNLILFKESVGAMINPKDAEWSLWYFWYSFSILIYGMSVIMAVAFGLSVFLIVAAMWGWDKVIYLFLDIFKEDDR